MIFPDAKAVFDQIPLRVIVALILIFPLLLLVGTQMLFGEENILYWLGYGLGSFYRMIADVIA